MDASVSVDANVCGNSNDESDSVVEIFNSTDIISRLDRDDMVSFLFILMGTTNTEDFLQCILEDTDQLRARAFCILSSLEEKEKLFVEILNAMKKVELLQLRNYCSHILNNSSSKQVCPFWVLMYEVCEHVAEDEHFKLLQNYFFPCFQGHLQYAEVVLYSAYEKKKFSKTNLTPLIVVLESFNTELANKVRGYQNAGGYNSLMDYYPFRVPTKARPLGIAIIINHMTFDKAESPHLETREFSDLDVTALENLWKMFGFTVEKYTDYDDAQIYSLFQNLSERDHSSYDAFVTCYMSHGNTGIIYTSNNKPICINVLIDYMANKCPTLVGKPKMFFFQACQGLQLQQGLSTPSYILCDANYDTPSSNDIPLFCDVLKVVSSIPGFVSVRVPHNKSWFIEALVEVFTEFGELIPVNNLILKITEMVSKKRGNINHTFTKQTVDCNSTLRFLLQLQKLKE